LLHDASTVAKAASAAKATMGRAVTLDMGFPP
jgi:hypothetical protein